MGPQKAAQTFASHNKDAAAFEVTLYGSLAATGRGHMTDVAIDEVLRPIAPLRIEWQPRVFLPFHPNGMKFVAFDKDKNKTNEWICYSVGGGALSEGENSRWLNNLRNVYQKNTLTDIQQWCEENGRGYWEYVNECEEEDIWDYLMEVWRAMQESVERGIDHEGALPGPLNLPRKGPIYYVKASGYKQSLQSRALVYAYALSVSEENASGGTIVTAPTCGSCGVLPAVLYHLAKGHKFSDIRILHALATAGIFGNVVKTNASISGADVGCQGEVGVACAMASAAACQLFGGSPSQIEYAAEMGLEHHLGMTCDPVCGLVQIPCIERNAVAAMRAMNACNLSYFLTGSRNISYDMVCRAMHETGINLSTRFRETSEGGLARLYARRQNGNAVR